MANRRTFVTRTGGAAAALALGARGSRGFAQDGTPEAATPEAEFAEIGDPAALPLRVPGRLTIHADQPLYPPWFIDNDPTNKEGFEGAYAYEISSRLGFEDDEVDWGYTSFNASYAPGPKDFDFYMTEVSITEERAQAVGFSISYHEDPLVIVTKDDSAVLDATTISELKPFLFATQVGTTFHRYLDEVIQPEQEILVFDTNADSLTALDNDTVDAVIQSLQIGIFNTTIQFEGMALGGILPGGAGGGMGLVTELGSELIPYLNEAIRQIRTDGTYDALVEEWLPLPPGLQEYEVDIDVD